MQKIDWVNSGKGFAIILVVLVHTGDWLLDAGLGLPAWDGINEAFATMRMPFFFLMSGLFAQKWIRGSWKELAANKLLFLYWVFLLWSVIGSFIHLFGLSFQQETTTPASFIGALFLSPIRPRFELWFVWALALFFIVAKLTRTWPLAVQFVMAAAVAAVWQSGVISVNIGWDGAAKHYLFFLLGVVCKEAILNIANRTPVYVRIGIVATWAVPALLITTTAAGDVPGVRFLVSMLGVVAGISLATFLAKVGFLRDLGQRTLPVYLAHTPIIVLIAFAASFGIFEVLPVYLRAVIPLIVAAIAVLLALQLHSWAQRGGLTWLYGPPHRLLAKATKRRGLTT